MLGNSLVTNIVERVSCEYLMPFDVKLTDKINREKCIYVRSRVP